MESIKDKVAIVGMGCTKFGENWDKSADDMLVDAASEACEDAGIEMKDIQAAWFGTTRLGNRRALRHRAQARLYPGHQGGKPLRYRHRSPEQCLFRHRLRRL